eukprot:evm.model.scf_832.1 EVM.evm.TU.scf_832.1   scf_832:54025-55977(-)
MGNALSRGGCGAQRAPLRHGAARELGQKPRQEDAYGGIPEMAARRARRLRADVRGVYVVCDGHGGPDVADYAARRLPEVVLDMLKERAVVGDARGALRAAFLRVDHEVGRLMKDGTLGASGTTAVLALFLGDRLFVAHVGDSRAVICASGRPKTLTEDHRPSLCAEQWRARMAGCGVTSDGYLLGAKDGTLAVTRALGDHHMADLRPPWAWGASPVLALPTVREVALTEEDEFLLLATDGLWDVVTSHTAVGLVRRELEASNDPSAASQRAVDRALRDGGVDNVTALTVCLKKDPLPPKKSRFIGRGSAPPSDAPADAPEPPAEVAACGTGHLPRGRISWGRPFMAVAAVALGAAVVGISAMRSRR